MTINTKTENGHVRVLSDGSQMPMLGLGVWQLVWRFCQQRLTAIPKLAVAWPVG